jgi:hypothetical protein
MGRFFLGFALLFGIGIMSSTTAQAQWQNNPYGQNRNYERQQRQRERELRREQLRREREARRNNRGYNNRGYNDPYGGYNNQRGYDGYGNYGGSLHLRQTALNAGANEGVKEGRKDRERGERFDYTDESVYQNATKDYSSRLGDRYAFQRYFREAFVNGYTEGYRGY